MRNRDRRRRAPTPADETLNPAARLRRIGGRRSVGGVAVDESNASRPRLLGADTVPTERRTLISTSPTAVF
jgi:hypothetical protein